MRLGLGLGFLHRLITVVTAAAPPPPSVVSYLLQQTSDFLMLEEPIQLLTQASDNLITQDGSTLILAQSEASGQIELEQ